MEKRKYKKGMEDVERVIIEFEKKELARLRKEKPNAVDHMGEQYDELNPNN